MMKPQCAGADDARVKLLPMIAFALMALFLAAQAHAEPYVPEGDETVLETLPTPGDSALRDLRRLRRALSENPKDLRRALALARRYIDVGRSEADPRYNGYAQAALAPWWSLARPPLEVYVLRAIISQSEHRFDPALEDLEQVLALQPDHPQARLSRAFILQVQGRIDEARESCRRLPASLHELVRATCEARMASLAGAAPSAARALSGALAAAGEAPPRLRLWALTLLAETAELAGDADLAERSYRSALSLEFRDVHLLAAYADFLLGHRRYAEVRALLAGETRVDALLLRLTLAEKVLGETDAESHVAALARRFEASRRRGDVRHRRTEARFSLRLADDPARALALALDNWGTQKEPRDARLVLEAALSAERPEAARPVIAWIAQQGLDDARLAPLVQRLSEGEG